MCRSTGRTRLSTFREILLNLNVKLANLGREMQGTIFNSYAVREVWGDGQGFNEMLIMAPDRGGWTACRKHGAHQKLKKCAACHMASQIHVVPGINATSRMF